MTITPEQLAEWRTKAEKNAKGKWCEDLYDLGPATLALIAEVERLRGSGAIVERPTLDLKPGDVMLVRRVVRGVTSVPALGGGTVPAVETDEGTYYPPATVAVERPRAAT